MDVGNFKHFHHLLFMFLDIEAKFDGLHAVGVVKANADFPRDDKPREP